MNPLFIFVLSLKVLVLLVFSSDYQEEFFIPFIEIFLNIKDNPWQYVYENSLNVEFPYHTLMLYAHGISYYPAKLIANNSFLVSNLFFKLPILISDLIILKYLNNLFPDRKKEVFLYYFCSPIIIYACYIHSQLDLFPMMLLFVSIYYLKKEKLLNSAILIGLACGTKLNVIVALPLIILYLYKNYKTKATIQYSSIVVALYLLVNTPFLFSSGFTNMVLFNQPQSLFFSLAIQFNQELQIFVTLFLLLSIYLRFAYYKKVNLDLLDSYLALSFALLVFTISPRPGWYVWIVPLISLLALRYLHKSSRLNTGYKNVFLALNIFYLLHFVFFHTNRDMTDVIFLGNALDLKLEVPILKNITFTFLEVSLLSLMYIIYSEGVRSNKTYNRNDNFLLCIAGDSGSGKTYLLELLRNLIRKRGVYLEGDSEHKWERDDFNWNKITHLNPKGNYLYLQSENLKKLKSGLSIQRREYDHKVGKFTNEKTTNPEDFIVIAGLHSFYLPKTRSITDLTIFLDIPDEIKHSWKLKRDVEERNHSQEEIVKNIAQRAEDFKSFIEVQRSHSDIVIEYTEDGSTELGSVHLEVHSSIDLEHLLDSLNTELGDLAWDYNDDLTRLKINIKNTNLSSEKAFRIMKQVIPNFEEIIPADLQIGKDLDAILSLFIVKSVSSKMIDKSESMV